MITAIDIDKIFLDNGYSYLPHEGPSGRPRFRKDLINPIGIIFFFPFYKIVNGDNRVHLLVRKVKTKYLETVYDEVHYIDEISKEFLEEIEKRYYVL